MDWLVLILLGWCAVTALIVALAAIVAGRAERRERVLLDEYRELVATRTPGAAYAVARGGTAGRHPSGATALRIALGGAHRRRAECAAAPRPPLPR